GQPLQAGLAVRRGERVKSDPPQQLDEDLARRLVIVDHQDLIRLLQHCSPSPEIDRVFVNGTQSFFPIAPFAGGFPGKRASDVPEVWTAVERYGTRFHRARSAAFTGRCPSRFTAC